MSPLFAQVLKVLLAATLGLVVLAQSATATAQPNSNTFEEAEGPDDTCDLRLNVGGPYEVRIAGGPLTIHENGSVVPVPQGSSVTYLRVERTIGSTAIGTNARCAVFAGETDSGVPLVVIVGVVIVGVVLVGAGLRVVGLGRRG